MSQSLMTILLSIFTFIGGIALTIIGYFLRKTMDDLETTEKLALQTKNELDVLKNDHTNKHEAMSEKFDDLKKAIDTLTGEIKHLTAKIK